MYEFKTRGVFSRNDPSSNRIAISKPYLPVRKNLHYNL